MGRKLYIADWHYGDNAVIAYDNRPFLSLHQMHQALICRWNSAANPDDTVYVLGDMFVGVDANTMLDVLRRLNGTKILVRGNHDNVTDARVRTEIADIGSYTEIKDEGRHVVLCHYPITSFKNQYFGWFHLYGHVHDGFEAKMVEHQKTLMQRLYAKPCNMYNVGAMMPYMDYTPRTLDEIIEKGELS